jgi:hypothetical protein
LFDAHATRLVLEAGWLMELHAWHKPAHRWECRVLKIQLPKEQEHGEVEPGDGSLTV